MKISQTLSGVTLAVAQSTAFQTAFINALASILSLPASAITINSVTAASRRSIRMLLDSGVSITYTVVATNTDPAVITSTITTASANGALTQAISDNGYSGVGAAPPKVLSVSTTTVGASSGASRTVVWYTGFSAVTALVVMALLSFW
jgi:hypothetical protein